MSEARESADELIDRARRVYAECASYADEGTMVTRSEFRWGGESRAHTKERRFRTRWKRPSAFLFEYVSPPDFETWEAAEESWERYVIWTSRDGPRKWWSIQKVLERPESIEHALGAAAGVSGGTARRIPSLLRVIEAPPRWFPSPAGFEGEVVELEGRECLCIPMRTGDEQQRLWLERSSGLVLGFEEHHVLSAESQRSDSQRRVERLRAEMAQAPETAHRYESLLRSLEKEAEENVARAPEPFTTHSRTLYRPRLNPQLRDDEFEFVPPAVS